MMSNHNTAQVQMLVNLVFDLNLALYSAAAETTKREPELKPLFSLVSQDDGVAYVIFDDRFRVDFKCHTPGDTGRVNYYTLSYLRGGGMAYDPLTTYPETGRPQIVEFLTSSLACPIP